MRKVRSCMVGLCLVLGARIALPALADQETYALEDGKAYRVGTHGEKTLLKDDEPMYWNTDTGSYAWILVDPEMSEAMKGSESGVYFFDADEVPLGFLPLEGAAYCSVTLNPGGSMIAVSCGTDVSQEVTVYSFDGFHEKATFTALGEMCWIAPCRIAFTMDDPKKGPRGGSLDQQRGWLSVMIYDSAVDEMFPVKEATETEDYMLLGCVEEGALSILRRSVRAKEDWKDDEKIEEAESVVPIPAAG